MRNPFALMLLVQLAMVTSCGLQTSAGGAGTFTPITTVTAIEPAAAAATPPWTPAPALHTPTPAPPANALAPTVVSTSLLETGRILFARDGHLWTSDAAAFNVVRLTPDGFYVSTSDGFTGMREFQAWPPLVSPDGRYVLATSGNLGTWLLRTDGGDQRRVSEHWAFGSWSPDSSAIAYYYLDRFYVRTLADWDHPRTIAQNDSATSFFIAPAWSPDGQWIALAKFPMQPGGRRGDGPLALVRPDGTQTYTMGTLAGSASDCCGPLQWSFDGKYLLVNRSTLWSIEPPNFHATSLNARDGTAGGRMSPTAPYVVFSDHVVRLGDALADVAMQIGDCHLDDCDWSADGSHFAFLRHTVEPSTGVSVRITNLATGQQSSTDIALPNAFGLHWLPESVEAAIAVLEPPNRQSIWRARLDRSAPPEKIGQGFLLGAFKTRK